MCEGKYILAETLCQLQSYFNLERLIYILYVYILLVFDNEIKYRKLLINRQKYRIFACFRFKL